MHLNNQEKWVVGYEGKYIATYQGEIFRVLKNGKKKQLKGYIKKNVYCVKLTDLKGVSKEHIFPRLIWKTFKGPIPDGYLVVKKIKVFTENGMHNLTLRTKAQHGKRTGPTSRSKAVELLDATGQVIDSWASARKAAIDLFVSYQTVMDICNRKIKKAPLINVRWSRKENEVR